MTGPGHGGPAWSPTRAGRAYGETYPQIGRDPTSGKAVDPQTKKPVANQARQIWVTETALTTALNTAFVAERVATFAIVMGLRSAAQRIGVPFLTLRALIPADKSDCSATAAVVPSRNRDAGP